MKTKNNKKRILFLGSILLILFMLESCVDHPQNTNKPKTSSKNNKTTLPTESKENTSLTTPADFIMKLINEEGVKVNMSQLKGKVIFINVWATWCRPCIEEMPDIQALYDKFNENVVFLLISKDRNFEKAKAFKERKNYEFNIYQVEGKLPALYRSNSIPMTYIIDTNGNLVMTYTGMGDFASEDFKSYLESLISE